MIQKQTLEQFVATGETSQSFATWYRTKNVANPDGFPLTEYADIWFDNLALYALEQAITIFDQ